MIENLYMFKHRQTITIPHGNRLPLHISYNCDNVELSGKEQENCQPWWKITNLCKRSKRVCCGGANQSHKL